MDKQVGIRNYERRRRDIVEMNLTSDLLSSVTFEDLLAAHDSTPGGTAEEFSKYVWAQLHFGCVGGGCGI